MDIYLLLQSFKKDYPLESLRKINEILKNGRKKALVKLLINFDMINVFTSVMVKNEYNFEKLFNGYIMCKVKSLNFENIPKVICYLIGQYVEEIDNLDDALQRLCIRAISYISSEDENINNCLVMSDSVLKTLISKLRTNTTMYVKSRIIFTLSNLLVDHEEIMKNIMPNLISLDELIDILLDFVSIFKCITSEDDIFKKHFSNVKDKANFISFTISELLRFCSHMKMADMWFETTNVTVKMKVINLLSMLKDCEDVYYKHYFIYMIWKITSFCLYSESRCIEEICQQGLISECIKYLNAASDLKITKLTAMRSIEFVITTYPIQISENSFTKLISDGLFIILNRVMVSKNCCKYVKSSCINILNIIIKDFMKIECLLKHQILTTTYKDLKVINSCNEHYNDLITLICNSIIMADRCIQQVINHYDNDLETLLFKFLICKETSDSNIKHISCVFRIISNTFNKIQIEYKNIL